MAPKGPWIDLLRADRWLCLGWPEAVGGRRSLRPRGRRGGRRVREGPCALANVKTRGRVDGDELVITGQKVWTSWSWDATMLFALVRTDPEALKHDGNSYVLVPIERDVDFRPGNGIELRPLRQIGGEAHLRKNADTPDDLLDG